MKPIDYIYKNLDSFNLSIFQQIVEESGEEVSESIYDYLMETTWNTNPALLKQFGLDIERSSEDESGSGEPDILVIQLGVDFEVGDYDNPRAIEVFNYCLRHSIEQDGQIICKALKVLYTDGEAYRGIDPQVYPDDAYGVLDTRGGERCWDFRHGCLVISESGDVEEYEEEG